jgi:hypothetical protein
MNGADMPALPLNLTECARPRAQQRPTVSGAGIVPQPKLLRALLRPRTGALRFRGSKREILFRRILSPFLMLKPSRFNVSPLQPNSGDAATAPARPAL